MKKVLLILAVVATAFTSCKDSKKEAKEVEVSAPKKVEEKVAVNNIDTKSSMLLWEGSKPTGTHDGSVMLKSGGLQINNDKLTGGEFVIDMTTIKNKDLDAESAGKLEGHLKSPDFFAIEKYPTSKFVITNVTEAEDKLSVTGNLTIKDITKSITIPAMLSMENGVTTFQSEEFEIDRTDFGVEYKSKKILDVEKLKDGFIDDDIKMSFTIKTKA